jgi:uncharacterized protein (DUF885 family)
MDERNMTATPALISRRKMLASTLASAMAAALPRLGRAVPAASAPNLASLLANFADELLQLAPETATSLGLDRGARQALKSRLDETSHEDERRWSAQVQSMLTRLATIQPSQLSPADRIHYESVKYSATAASEGTHFFYGSGARAFNGGSNPYVVSQQNGALTRVPEFLNTQHQIASSADAEAYLERIGALARLLDQESSLISEHAARGVMPPNFIASNALGQRVRFRQRPVTEQPLVHSLASRAKAQGIQGAWDTRAAALVQSQLYPALDRQIAAFAKATAQAPETAGIYRLPDGDAYYHWALKLGTTTDLSAAEVHSIGLDQNRAIQARIDTIFKAQGLTQGSVAERARALNSDPRQLVANTDQGRQELLDYCMDRMAATRALVPKISGLGLKAPLMVKRVPADIEDGAALGYMNPASLDGVRPAIYYINLKSTVLWPKYQIPTLTAHEGIPGHAWQGAYRAEHSDAIPLILQLIDFNAYTEGWALYAEQSVDEFGFYDHDPFGQIGYLQGQQFRACRLVVDTGLHAMHWTREQAIEFLVTETGKGREAMTSEIDRYCANPGQACGYKIGHNEILKQRERLRSAMGDKFKLTEFNDAVIMTGGLPVAQLGAAVDQLLAAR